MIEGSGSRAGTGSASIPLTSGSGSGRPKNTWIRWIGSATLTESTENWVQGQGCAYLEHVHGVVCVGEAEQQAVEDLLPAQLTHFSVTREQRQCLQTKRGTKDDSGYMY